MSKTVTHIEVPKEWEPKDDYSSHRPALWLAVNESMSGPVAEFGCGEGSTSLLYDLCKHLGRSFYSFETNFEYASKYPCTIYIPDYKDIKSRLGVVFIDSAPGEERKILIKNHANSADVVVVHDTEPGCQNIYGITEVLNDFMYRLDYYPEGIPGTTILSNFINVEEWI